MSDESFNADAKTLESDAALISWLRVNYRCDGAMGVTPQEWEELDGGIQAAWIAAFEKINQEATNPEPKTVGQMAEMANRTFQCTVNPNELTPWEDILPEYQIKWACLSMYVRLLLEWTTDDSPLEHYEEEMVRLFKEKIAEIPKEETACPPPNRQVVEPTPA